MHLTTKAIPRDIRVGCWMTPTLAAGSAGWPRSVGRRILHLMAHMSTDIHSGIASPAGQLALPYALLDGQPLTLTLQLGAIVTCCVRA